MMPQSAPTSDTNGAPDIAANLKAVRETAAAAAHAAGRSGGVEIIAVSKAHPAAAAERALAAGHRVFGENRVQEAQTKWSPLKEAYSDARLHLIGPLQTNKVRDALALFDTIETLDRPRLARALAKEMAALGVRPDCLVQINTGEEEQKSGIVPREADAFIALCRDELVLPIRGLMCIPPPADEPSVHFALLAKIAARNELSDLSMGMTHDFEIAVAFGATHVRIGTAIFGARAPVHR